MFFSTNKAFFVIAFLLLTSTLTYQQTLAQSNPKMMRASKKINPVSDKEIKKAKAHKPWDKKAPKMILRLHKPTLEVLNHTMRILVKSDKEIFHLKGKASDVISGVEEVRVDGHPVNVDEKGNFEAFVHLEKAYTVVKIEAIDKSGNSQLKEVAIQRTSPLQKTTTNKEESNAAERWVAPVKK